MKKIIFFSCILFFFCGHLFSQEHAVTKTCAGVLINGICWAESNVDRPGTFAATPEAYGMLYQWNRKKGWPPTGTVSGWDGSYPTGGTWEAANDPCPAGWRVPTIEEISALMDNSKVTSVVTSQNEIYGRKFTDKATGNTIFLPGVVYRSGNDHTADNSNYNGWYWSSTSSSSEFAWILFFIDSPYLQKMNFPKYFSTTVRCVADGNITSCDSIVKDTSETICAGDLPYTWGDTVFQVGTETGKFRFRRTSTVTGCDSIVYLTLTVHPAVQQTLYDSICPSERYIKHGFDLSDVTASGSFQLFLKTVHGCDSIVILDLYVYPTYLLAHSETICQGDTIDFRGRQLYESGMYYDSLTTVKGCDSIYCINLTVNPTYDIQLSGILCEGSSYTEQGFNVSQAGVYHRYLKTNSGCDSVITLSLTEEKKLQGSIGLLLEDCTTHTYTFFFEPEIPVSSCQWDMGDGSIIHSERGVHTYADSGVYRIQLRAETFNGCENTFSYVQHVPCYMPEVQLQADREIIDEDFPTVKFCAEVLPEMACVWDFGDGKTGEGNSVSHTYTTNSEKYYDVILKVSNADSCITESRAQIEVAFLPKLVNTFSPNGDGINDIFMPGYRVEIVNRNGLQIYVGDNGWDGTYKGKQAPEDTYFYRLYYQTAGDEEKMKTGYVALIR